MNRIKQLSKQLANQIAAGEVIERPASVVKELVENSIDAKATKISVEVSNEGRDLRVADNGSGIHPDDILLAFSKHATSKIATDEDLFNIETLGFRGEALASIISIAKLSCTTRTKDFDYGTKVEAQNSEVKNSQTGCAVGTIMEVKDLFFNLPARLKFLKNPKTEFSYIQELVQNLALINPQIAFELKNNGKTVLKTNGLNHPKETIEQVCAKVEGLREVLKTDKLSGFKISGFVSTPDYTLSSKKGYHIYINSRTVKCPVFQKSVDMVYKNIIGIGKYAFVVLNLEIPPADIDVNVHPTKKEVRYKNPNQVFNFIYSAVDGALSNIKAQAAQASQQIEVITEFKALSKQFETQSDDVYVEQASLGFENSQILKQVQDDVGGVQNYSGGVQNYSGGVQNYSGGVQNYSGKGSATSIQSSAIIDMEYSENIIGQYKNTYILIEKEDGLEIVDQHIADERYLYEQLKANKQNNSQLLFISDMLSVSPIEAQLIKENMGKFEKFGYGIEFLKSEELIFRKVPQMLARVNPKEILADILENIQGDIDNLEEKILITTSCKAAVKAHQKLNMYEMQQVIKKWRTCDKPYTCPHGRPISKVIEHKDLAKFFERQK